jgi:hypothetical protein
VEKRFIVVKSRISSHFFYIYINRNTESMKIRHNRVIAAIILILGAFVLFAGLFMKAVPSIFIGLLNVLIGIMMMVQPQLVISRSRVELKNLLGMTMKTRDFDYPSQLELEDSKFYINRNGKREKIMTVNKIFSHGPDVDALRSYIAMQKNVTPTQQQGS